MDDAQKSAMSTRAVVLDIRLQFVTGMVGFVILLSLNYWPIHFKAASNRAF